MTMSDHVDTAALSMRDARSTRAPQPYRPDAPDIVVIVLDDLGFAQLGCFGSDLETPNLDRLAARGVRFTNFHTTAICSPTRACLLTGRNHHRVGMGMLPDLPVNFPGYTGVFPDDVATIAEILRADGYLTAAIGKRHLTARDQRATGPYDMWPTGVGFEHYYGFLNGETNQWTPNLIRDQHHVEPPATPDDGYHLDADLADEAIRRLRDWRLHQPDRPSFLWYATAAPHAPHQAPPEWIERFRGRFDRGWDVWREETFTRQKAAGIVPADAELSPRPDWVEAWADIEPDRRRLYARMMEVFAGFLAHADHHIGRVLDAVEERWNRQDYRSQFAELKLHRLPQLLVHELTPLGVLAGAELPPRIHTLGRPVLSHQSALAFYRGEIAPLPDLKSPEGIEVGKRTSLIGQYRSKYALSDEDRARMIVEICRYRREPCVVAVAAWETEGSDSELLPRILKTMRQRPEFEPFMAPEVWETLVLLFDPEGAEIPVEQAAVAQQVFYRYYSFGDPFPEAAMSRVRAACEAGGQCAP